MKYVSQMKHTDIGNKLILTKKEQWKPGMHWRMGLEHTHEQKWNRQSTRTYCIAQEPRHNTVITAIKKVLNDAYRYGYIQFNVHLNTTVYMYCLKINFTKVECLGHSPLKLWGPELDHIPGAWAALVPKSRLSGLRELRTMCQQMVALGRAVPAPPQAGW